MAVKARIEFKRGNIEYRWFSSKVALGNYVNSLAIASFEIVEEKENN